MSTDVSGGKLLGFTVNGTDASALVQKIEVFESIYTPGISTKVMLTDAAGLYSTAKLQDGEAKLNLKYSSRNGESVDLNLTSAHISDRTRSKDNTDLYTITGVPNELLKNNAKSLKDAYKNMSPKDIRQKMFDEYMKGSDTKNRNFTDDGDSGNKTNFHPTQNTPLHGMNWANRNSKPGSKPGAQLFYQTTKGYYNRSLEKLNEGSAEYEFNYGQQNIGGGSDPNKNIISFYDQTNANKMEPNQRGATGSETTVIDPVTGQIKKIERKGKNGEVTERNVVFTRYTKDSNFIKKRAGEDQNTSREPGAENEASATKGHQLENKIITIQVPGDTKYEVGKKAKINLSKNNDGTEKDDRSGEYLVVSNKTVLYKVDDDFKMVNVLELRSSKDADKGTA